MKSIRTALLFATFVSLSWTSLPALSDGDNRAQKVFTPEMAQSVLGTPVKSSAEPDTDMGKTWVSRVKYSPSAEGSKQTAGVLIRHAATKEEAQNIFEQSKSTFHGEDVVGLGDSAYRTKMPTQLNVLKGSNWLIITVGTFKAPDAAGQEKLAKELLPKITF